MLTQGEQVCIRLDPSLSISHKHADRSSQHSLITAMTELKSREPGKMEEGHLIAVYGVGEYTWSGKPLGEG